MALNFDNSIFNNQSAGGSEGRGPLAVLEQSDAFPTDGSPSKKGVKHSKIIYPERLGTEFDHWVCFRASKEHKFRAEALEKQDSQCFIYLPMPSNLNTGYTAGYQQTDLGAAGAFTADGEGNVQDPLKAAAAATATNLVEELAGAGIGAAVGKVTKASGLVSTIVGATAGQSALGSAKASAMGFLGVALNPHKAMLYQGTEFRTHAFSYQFAPKNHAESQKLVSIVGLFKYFMSPGRTSGGKGIGGAFLNYPEQFDIDFRYGKNLFDIGTSVLTSFNVNYTPQGTQSYFDVDGEKYPTSVNMDLNFTEVTIVDKERIIKHNR